MAFHLRPPFDWQLRTRSLSLGRRTLVMGVLNVTPDSFSDKGRFWTPSAAIEGALAMLDEGAAIIDIGGESTRPGSRKPLDIQEEIDRVQPVVEGVLRDRPEAILSIDTYHGATAGAALRAGAEIVNDVSGLLWDPSMAGICAAAACGLVLSHTRGRPEEWQALPPLPREEVMPLVQSELRRQMEVALTAGLRRQHIVLDPGFGFGKIRDENYALLAQLRQLRDLGQPVLAGVSRKSFLGHTLSSLYEGHKPSPELRENASLAAATAAILGGADLVRAHSVRPTVEAAAIADAILEQGYPQG